MASPLTAANVFIAGTWFLQYGLERGPLVGEGGWYRKAAGFGSPGELGGFIGQSRLHCGATPRGPTFSVWQYDPDAGLEVLNGEIRVERAAPVTLTGLPSTVIPRFEGDVSCCYATALFPTLAKYRIGGNLDYRFIQGNTFSLTVGYLGEIIVEGDMIAQHWTRATPRGTVLGTLDLRWARIPEVNGLRVLQRNRRNYGGDTFGAWNHVDASYSNITTIEEGFRANGDLIAKNCRHLRSIGRGVTVGGKLDLTDSGPITIEAPSGTDAVRLEVGGDLILRGSKFQELPPRVNIGGNVDARETKFNRSDFPGWTIAGDVIR